MLYLPLPVPWRVGSGTFSSKKAMAQTDTEHDGVLHPGDLRFARAVLESTPAVIYVYDVQLERSIYQNRRLSELMGHGP